MTSQNLNDKRIDIAFVLPALNSGGAEKNTILLADEMRKQGLGVEIVVMEKKGSFVASVPSGLPVREIGAGFLGAVWSLSRYIIKQRPRRIVAGLPLPNIIAIISGIMTGRLADIFLTQHHPFALNARYARKSRTSLAKFLFPCARHFIAVSQGVAEDLVGSAGVRNDRITVISNPVCIKEIERLSKKKAPGYPVNREGGSQAILVGRLAPPKDIETPLEALKECPDLNLVICGEGPERQKQEDYAKSAGVRDRVVFTGFVDNPYTVMAGSDLLILSSRHEGFGNVLIEAMAIGLPVVATDCPYGPSEILDGGRFGELVPIGESHEMAEAIKRVLEGRHPDPQILKSRAQEYDLNIIVREYRELLNL